MELNYRPANYTGWPVPALFHYFLCISLHATKLRKISESCNIFRNYFTLKCKVFFDKISDWLPPVFTKPSNTFSVAFQKVSEGFAASLPSPLSLNTKNPDAHILGLHGRGVKTIWVFFEFFAFAYGMECYWLSDSYHTKMSFWLSNHRKRLQKEILYRIVLGRHAMITHRALYKQPSVN